MPEGHRIKPVEIGEYKFLVLANGDRPTFLERASKERAARMASFMRKVEDNGVDWALAAEVFKIIKGTGGSIAIFELKCKGTPIRVMTYIHDGKERTPIYLFDIVFHSGADSGYTKDQKRKATRLAEIARNCMETKGNGNG